jgi:hypothetical protein
MEATVFSGRIYDHLQPHAAALKVAHPLMLRAIGAVKKRWLSYNKQGLHKAGYFRELPANESQFR